MKVSIIEPVGAHGGMNYYDAGLLNGLLENSVNVDLHTCDANRHVWKGSSRVHFTFSGIFGSSPMLSRAKNYIVGSCSAVFRSKINKVKLVHVHLFHYGFKELFLVLLAKSFFMKIVATIHDVESFANNEKGGVRKLIMGLVDGAIVHNEYSRRSLLSVVSLPASRIHTVPHGNYLSSVNKMDKVEARKRVGLSADESVVLFFGQIKKVKALDVLLRACPEISGEVPRLKILVAGKYWKNSGEEYQRIIDELKIADQIRLDIGYVPDELVDAYYNAADVVVLPYREIFQSGVLLMAMSYQVPVICSAIPGMLDILEEGVNGLTFPRDDHHILARQVIRVLKDSALASSLADNAFNHIKVKHDWNEIGRLTRDCYASLLSRKT